ncbi:MAG: glycerol-3-phosphate responsive antiterminator [Velocimicrobium sp.]
MNQIFYDAIAETPIIAAIKDQAGFDRCLLLDSKVVFVLFGDICNIKEITARLKQAGKIVMVHVDLISGLSSKEIAVDYMKENTQADGIISTRQNIIKRGKDLSMFTIFRFFVIDSMALASIERQQGSVKADFIEILPGVMPKIIHKVCRMSTTPVIVGGLITDKEDVMMALDAGAIAISTTNQDVWKM